MLTINNTNYFNTPLSKLKIEYPEYVDTIRIFLANACSYAERNLKECGYSLFSGKLEDNEYKKITQRLKGLSNYTLKSLYNFLYSIRSIHNYSYHYYYNDKVTINDKFIEDFKPLANYDYDYYENSDDKYKEITFYGAIIIISSLLDNNQIKSVSEDFKSLFSKYGNPIYLNIMDETKAKKHLAKVMLECSNRTTPFVNLKMVGETKNTGFDTNTIFRRYLGKLFFKIEEYSNEKSSFYNKISSLNLTDGPSIKKLIDLRNWYSHGGYIFDEYDYVVISPENIINILYDIYRSNIDIRIKDVIKEIALEHLRNSFEFMSKYSIKLFDKDILIDGLKNKRSAVDHRIKNLDYNNPLNTNFYSDKAFTKLMEIIDNTYSSNYNDLDEFHGYIRKFTTNNIMFITLKSSSNISIGGNVTKNQEITFINPLLFKFNTEDDINYVTVNGIKLTDILPNKSSKVISHKTINLDEYERSKNDKQYLFYDIECANCHNNTGKISSLGYVVTNDRFEILESNEITINPEAPFYHDVKISGKKEHIPFTDLDTTIYDNSPTYDKVYDQIKELFSRDNTVYLGYSNISDAYFMFESNKRYNLPNFNYQFIDIKDMIDYLRNKDNKISLKKLVRDYLHTSWKQAHNSKEDALMTAKLLEVAMKKHAKDDIDLVAILSNAIYDVRDDSVMNGNTVVEKIMYPDMYLSDNVDYQNN